MRIELPPSETSENLESVHIRETMRAKIFRVLKKAPQTKGPASLSVKLFFLVAESNLNEVGEL